LENEELRATVLGMVEEVVNRTVERFAGGQRYVEEWDLRGLLDYAYTHFLPSRRLGKEQLDQGQLESQEVRERLLKLALEDYDTKEKIVGSERMRDLERLVTLRIVDAKWMEHLDSMDQMRQGIGLRAIGQRDPLVEYKHEAFDMFGAMIADIQEEIVRTVYFAQLVERPQERRNLVEQHNSLSAIGVSSSGGGNSGAGPRGAARGGRTVPGDGPGAMAGAKKQPAVSSKIGRNDLCPCGSGKKYKKCCGKEA
jgi:preprotein translocase subunit SecA